MIKNFLNSGFKNPEINIKLIILEKFATTFQTFLKYENITIPAFRDSAGILFNHDLLPTTPMKLYLDDRGMVDKISSIGATIDPKQDEFIASINNQ